MKTKLYSIFTTLIILGSNSSLANETNSRAFTVTGSKSTKTKIKTLSKSSTISAIRKAYKEQSQALKKATTAEMKKKVITHEKFTMPYNFIKYGKEPKDGHSLYISLHGGGNAPAATNDGQWRGQLKLYKPKEGIYVAPRAATNTWNLWHEAHIDPMFEKLIDRFIVHHGINPNRIYLLGYSAGGDGLYQLAPRMADRWAAAAMMAGHPGDAQTHNLFNLPFILQCGGQDRAYKRNILCQKWGDNLAKLEKENPGHYPHKCIVYPQYAHWMKRECKVALPWMAKNTRNPWNKKIVWFQDDVLHTRFSWLANDSPAQGDLITAEVKGQTITLTTENVKKITLRLNDKLINLSRPIIVQNHNDKVLFKGAVSRSKETIKKSLRERLDVTTIATAELVIELP